ncbi:MAG: NUDIX domain-containing protein [Actinobacteria bacterium]|nr:NUDIX domain-containing protein [Actinomycetota bacterium]
MAELVYGDRIAKQGKVLLGCSAVAFDRAREKVLLTRRTDNGRWCLPGGALDPGESVTESVIREFREETGLRVRVVRLVGIYSDPNRLLQYADGNQFHVISLHFEVAIDGGELTLSDETSEFVWAPVADLSSFDPMEHHVERISDSIIEAEPVVK